MGVRKLDTYDILEDEKKDTSLECTDASNSSKVADNFEIDKSMHAKGNLVFIKPPHYDKSSDEKQTRISVVDRAGEKEISRGDLESYITQNRKINKIVIEEVKANDVKRTNLIFDEKKKPRKQISSKSNLNGRSIEKQLNQSFLDGAVLGRSNTLKNEFEEAVALLAQNEKTQPKKKAQTIEVLAPDNIEKESEIDFGTSGSKSDKEEVKSEEEFIFSDLSMEDSSGDENVAEVEISRHEFKRKNNKSLSKLYYKVKNHIELFKLGDSYLRDFNRGIKSLAFNSSGMKGEREKTVLGVTSFLNYNAKITVTVVTDDLQKTLYHNHIQDLEEVKKPILGEDASYTCYATQGVEFVEFSEICDVMYQLGNTSFEEFVDQFVEGADVVLWDLPELKEMDNKKEVFYPVIRSLESVSLVVKANESKYTDLHQVKDYFEKYKVPFKGLVLAV